MHSTVNGTGFEIPDTWWESGGMLGFAPYDRAFKSSPSPDRDIVVVPISDIAPPERSLSAPFLFDKERMISILRAFHDATPLPPVEVKRGSDPYRYSVFDGYHRYYASAAAGFLALPVIDFFDAQAFLATEEQEAEVFLRTR